jgi:trans-aconitate 2-methyltransferase
MKWDPQQYARYGDERSRPFFDLVDQIQAKSPASVADLGCGPGNLTATLAERWPGTQVIGIDSSPEMIAQAHRFASEAVSFALAQAESFSAVGLDLLVSNALLQWVPGHLELLKRWAAELNDGGWLAFQVPANFDLPSHQLMRAIAGSPRWRGQLGEVLRHREPVATPGEYLDLLADAGLRVNAWQTEYLHVLQGDDPVLQWVRGTGLRPVLEILSDTDRASFEASYATLLRDAYPQRSYGTVFPFRRTFVVASK